MRGIAAIGIALYHVTWTNHLTEWHFFRNGFLYVDLFFVLSGFVLASVYHGRINNFGDYRQY